MPQRDVSFSERDGPQQSRALPAGDAGPVRERPRLQALTGLRMLAALAVYFSHMRGPLGAPEWLLTVQQSGYAGVTFFFVLSGFVLTLNYFDSLRTPRAIRSYVVARLARVYPLYLVVLAWPTVHLWAEGALPKHELLLHVLGVQSWHPNQFVLFPFIPPAWSISVELFLYATLPLLVIGARLIDGRMWTILASVLVVLVVLGALALYFQQSGRADLVTNDPASAHRWLYRMPLTRIGDFLLGILAARVFVRLRNRQSGRRLGSWLIPASLTVTLVAAAQPDLLLSAWSWDVLYAVPATSLILGLALAPEHRVSRFLALRPVVFLGEVSFAFYLIHYTLIVDLEAGAWSEGVTAVRLVTEVENLALAVGLAIGLHVAVEKPGRTLVMRLLDRRPPPAPRPDSGSGRPVRRGPVRVDQLRPAVPAPRSGAPLDGLTAPMPAVPGPGVRPVVGQRPVPALPRR
jgi:peptidoglycan/LPS O-acetylase OafA/YrhL